MPYPRRGQKGDRHGRRAACMSKKQEGHRCRNVHRKTGQDVMSTIHSTSQFRDVVGFRTSMITCAVSSVGPRTRDLYTSCNVRRCLSGRVVVFGVVVYDGTCIVFFLLESDSSCQCLCCCRPRSVWLCSIALPMASQLAWLQGRAKQRPR